MARRLRFDRWTITFALWGLLGLLFVFGSDPEPNEGVGALPFRPATPLADEAFFTFRDIAVDPSPFPPGIVTGEPRRPGLSSGTAFLIREQPPTWLTARHVTDGCDDLRLVPLDSRPRGSIGVLQNHPTYDAAVLGADRGSGTVFPLADRYPKGGDTGIGVGFPGGSASVVEARVLGVVSRQFAGVLSLPPRLHQEWLVTRYPVGAGVDRELGGISGGPLILADGRVAGIVVAHNPRRARLSVVPIEIAEAADPADRSASAPPQFSSATAQSYGFSLLHNNSIVQVLCAVR